jgi:hypothetical protein
MTRRQINKQWSGGIVDHPAPKISEGKNPVENFSPEFFGIKTVSSTLIFFLMLMKKDFVDAGGGSCRLLCTSCSLYDNEVG